LQPRAVGATAPRRHSSAAATAAAPATGGPSTLQSLAAMVGSSQGTAPQHRPPMAPREDLLIHLPAPAAASGGIGQQAAAGVDSPCDGISGTPLHEVALAHLHKRSSPLRITFATLAQGLDSARRLDALEWLVQAFDALNLSDSQLYAAFGLLDRFAAASPGPISAGPGAFAYVLAAMLVALKVSGTQRDLERAKRLVIEASGTPRPWAAVRKAELQILRRLGFRACTPTCLDFLERLLGEALESRSASLAADGLEADAQSKCCDLARLLLELGLVHEPEAVYGSAGHPPLASALAALFLALKAFRAPPSCAQVLREHVNLLESGEAIVGELAEAMRSRWQSEERKSTAAGANSAVLDKWKRRMGARPGSDLSSIGASVPSSLDVRQMIPEGKESLKVAADDSDAFGASRRLRGKQAATSPGRAATTMLLAPPTAVSRPATDQVSSKTPSTSVHGRREVLEAPSLNPPGSLDNILSSTSATTAAPSSARPASTSGGSGGEVTNHRGSSTLGSGSTHGPAVSASRYPSSQLVSALSRAAASENLSSWPLSSVVHGQEDGVDKALAQIADNQRKEALSSPHNAKGGPSTSRGTAIVPHTATSPEPLVELTHVLNMVHPTSTRPGANNGATSGLASCSKPKPPSVASELLVSSALRLAWPPDRRKGVDLPVAASSCREAATVLEEAAQYLRLTAASLDSGMLQARELKGTSVGNGSESKRRKTFGGPSPARATSPSGGTAGGTSQPHARGSPPVCRGIRV